MQTRTLAALLVLFAAPAAAQAPDFKWTGTLAAGKTIEIRGVNGGYKLSKAPNEISVARIITAVDDIIALIAKQCVDPRPSGQRIRAIASDQEVIARTAIKDVVTRYDKVSCFIVAEELVVVLSTGQNVVAAIADKNIVASPSIQVIGPALGRKPGETAGGVKDRRRQREKSKVIPPPCSHIIPSQLVVSVSPQQHIVAQTGKQEVVACAAVQVIGADRPASLSHGIRVIKARRRRRIVIAQQLICALTTKQHIVVIKAQ